MQHSEGMGELLKILSRYVYYRVIPWWLISSYGLHNFIYFHSGSIDNHIIEPLIIYLESIYLEISFFIRSLSCRICFLYISSWIILSFSFPSPAYIFTIDSFSCYFRIYDHQYFERMRYRHRSHSTIYYSWNVTISPHYLHSVCLYIILRIFFCAFCHLIEWYSILLCENPHESTTREPEYTSLLFEFLRCIRFPSSEITLECDESTIRYNDWFHILCRRRRIPHSFYITSKITMDSCMKLILFCCIKYESITMAVIILVHRKSIKSYSSSVVPGGFGVIS